jgi:CubicO group peptidase (beta-lactamase class C family)
LGTETDAYATIDASGFAVADGGICVSLRDLARFGRMVADACDAGVPSDGSHPGQPDQHGLSG